MSARVRRVEPQELQLAFSRSNGSPEYEFFLRHILQTNFATASLCRTVQAHFCLRRPVVYHFAVLGILVHGDNHFIVRGPSPDRATALALVRHWSLIRIGATTPQALEPWVISTREFRENLQWAVIAPGETRISIAVAQLLAELTARGIMIDTIRW
jgi:hypothetical protein